MFLKNTRTKNFKRAAAIFFVALSFVSATVSAEAQTAQKVEDLVQSISGGKLKVETRATPHQLVADFDGDKIKDVAVVVRLADTPENVAKAVRVEYPYYYKKEVDPEILALMIIHGKGKGWQFAQKNSVLFLGRNSALIFQKSRLDEAGDAMKLEKDKSGRAEIYFITEGSDGTLKWNGKKYVWTESEP